MNKKIIAAAVVLLVAAGAWLGAEEKLPKPATKEAAKLMEKAQKAVTAKDLDGALALYAEVQKLEPAYAPAFLTAALVYRMKQDDENALSYLEKAVQANPEFLRGVDAYAQLLAEKGRQMSAQGKPAASLPYFSRLVAIPGLDMTHKTAYIDGLFNMGISAFQARQFDVSVEAFTKLMAVPDVAVAAKPSFLLTHYMLGFNLSLLDKPEEANGYLRKYVELVAAEPGNNFAPVADYMIAKNEYTLLDKEVAKLRSDKEVTDVMAKVKTKAAEYANIPELLGKAIAGKPELEDAYLVLGNYQYLAGDLDQAIASYKTLLEKFAGSANKAEYESFLKKLEEEKAAPEAKK
ncbi:MAG TPA: tetratricopeptide repeat protein [Acidobacteriota bacterium]|nr:tetratricopeptide repeat protein [Acidobacteriota bacterium]